MFSCDHSKLRLSFNEFHDIRADGMPEYGEFCLLRLKDGRLTGGEWNPRDWRDRKSVSGEFVRGTADAVDAAEVSGWHSLDRYDLSECLEDEEINRINIGPVSEGVRSEEIGEFRSTREGELPKNEQYCLLIMNDGGLASGRWDADCESFVYAPALASHSAEDVWAWTPLSPDDVYEAEEEAERERAREEELNRDPAADPELFRYGTDIEVYYEKALGKLREKYPWATVAQMKKKDPYIIAPRHGRYVFGRDGGTFMGSRIIDEWTDGSTADEFIEFLYRYTEESVKDSEPVVKFRYGTDIGPYLDKAFENAKKDCRWIDREKISRSCRYEIKKVDGDPEFVRLYGKKGDFSVINCRSSEDFIETAENDYIREALRTNPAVEEYAVPFAGVEIHGWYLEKYIFYKLRTGDYKVEVQAGDRVTGGTREFLITPYCFEAGTYGEFLDRYLEIVPGSSFGLYKEDLLGDAKLKEFLGY